jgi:hypothetical protein
MSRKWLGGFAAVLAMAGIGIARADVIPWSAPPEFLDRDYGNQIREAGYDCPQIKSVESRPLEDPAYKDMAWGEQNPLLFTCTNSKRFVVAQPPKRPLHSEEPLPPPPAVRVRPL